jgi:hypothetical protein
MKKLSIIFALFVVASCNKKQNTPSPVHASCTSVIDDRTDSFALHPLADPILSICDFQCDRDQEASLRLVLLTDKLLNPIEEIHLSDGKASEAKNVNDEVDNREQLVYSYCDAFRNAVDNLPKRFVAGGTLQHSECFATIASEMEYLSGNRASQKTLIVFSDLQENSDVFSCYTPSSLKLLQNHPEKVAVLLQSRHPLPRNLVGITVYFVYLPLTRQQDQQFSAMVDIYRRLLKERGARVVVQAQNTFYQP